MGMDAKTKAKHVSYIERKFSGVAKIWKLKGCLESKFHLVGGSRS